MRRAPLWQIPEILRRLSPRLAASVLQGRSRAELPPWATWQRRDAVRMRARLGLFVDRDFTKQNSTTNTMNNEGLAVGRPHVLYPRALSIERDEVLFAIELRGRHREANRLPRSPTPHFQRDASRCDSNRCDQWGGAPVEPAHETHYTTISTRQALGKSRALQRRGSMSLDAELVI